MFSHLFKTQVRFLRKNFKLNRGSYGIRPLFLTEHYLEAKENNRLAELEFQPIRFALLRETDSPFYDDTLEKFTNFVMKGGRMETARELMHMTMFEIKTIQLKRLRKKQEAQRELEAGDETALKKNQKKQVALDPTEAEELIETNPLVIFKEALKNCEPAVITRNVRRGGAVYQVPYPVTAKESEFLSFKWIIDTVRDRPKPRVKSFAQVMAQELLDAYHKTGKVIKKRDDLHRLAEANKAYAHYRWG